MFPYAYNVYMFLDLVTAISNVLVCCIECSNIKRHYAESVFVSKKWLSRCPKKHSLFLNFNQTCIDELLLPNYSFIHIYWSLRVNSSSLTIYLFLSIYMNIRKYIDDDLCTNSFSGKYLKLYNTYKMKVSKRMMKMICFGYQASSEWRHSLFSSKMRKEQFLWDTMKDARKDSAAKLLFPSKHVLIFLYEKHSGQDQIVNS